MFPVKVYIQKCDKKQNRISCFLAQLCPWYLMLPIHISNSIEIIFPYKHCNLCRVCKTIHFTTKESNKSNNSLDFNWTWVLNGLFMCSIVVAVNRATAEYPETLIWYVRLPWDVSEPFVKLAPLLLHELHMNCRVFCNRPFPSCLVPPFQSRAWCPTFHMKMKFICIWVKTHLNMKG